MDGEGLTLLSEIAGCGEISMANRWARNAPNGPTRAQRFAISMPILYKRTGETWWVKGQVQNISRSGVLFETLRPMDVKTVVDLNFELRAEIGGEVRAVVVCRGEVVRHVLPATPDGAAALAAKILEYRLVRGRNDSDA